MASYWGAELAGLMESQWGEDVNVTLDDKLHKSLTTPQTMAGPVNWTTTATHTFAGQISGSTLTISSTATFSAIDLINTIQEFSTDGALSGNSDTVVPTEKAVKTYTDLRALWNSDNSAITRFACLGGRGLLNLTGEDGTHNWTYDDTNLWVESSTVKDSYIAIQLPHGAVVTALRVTGQITGSAQLNVTLTRHENDNTGLQTLASVWSTVTMGEESDTSPNFNSINNDLYSYSFSVRHTTNAAEVRLVAIQVDYTVVRPQP